MTTPPTPSALRRALAQRVAEAHVPLGGGRLLALLSGSVVEDIADDRSDLDMGLTFETLPLEPALREACLSAGGQPWFWHTGTLAEGSLVVAFMLDGIEVQIGYSDQATLARELEQVLLDHEPDTPNHKLAEGLLRAEALVGAAQLHALQARLAAFPEPLARAMAAHFLGRVTPWRAISQLPRAMRRCGAVNCRCRRATGCWARWPA